MLLLWEGTVTGLEIHDDGIEIDDILKLIRKEAAASVWTCRYLEVEGASQQALEHAAEEGIELAGAEFLELVADIDHTVEGDFSATRAGKKTPWVMIRAVAGESFEVFTRDRGVLAHIESIFHDVRPAGFSGD
jgi:hypothetical protein